MLLQSTGEEEEEGEENEDDEKSTVKEEEEENQEDSLLPQLAQIVQDAQKRGSKWFIQKLKVLVEEKMIEDGHRQWERERKHRQTKAEEKRSKQKPK